MCLIPHWVRGAWDSGRCTGGAPQIYNEQMKRALQGLPDRKGLPRWPNGPVSSFPTHPHCPWPWGWIFASGLQELPLSLSSSLQGSMACVGRLTSMWVIWEAESLGDATGVLGANPGPGRGEGGLLSALSPSKAMAQHGLSPRGEKQERKCSSSAKH